MVIWDYDFGTGPGSCPHLEYSSMKVLLRIMQNALPALYFDDDKKFSKSFKHMVTMCLVKDPSNRPTSEKLPKHSFFKHAKPPQQTLEKLFEHMEPNANDWCTTTSKSKENCAYGFTIARIKSHIEQSFLRVVSDWTFLL
ncbi:hypothetical protein CCACVL1_09314 [Corchorus capsularis]|uniref:Protein kinase domain-containing protein n=1 Tax=Corchorus capsularis TaxID=210143 RepID=A0A1R3IWQ9_COCAP|nr:hypothetical protein CCACVL1_09314 [Corchorus capsularis]